MAMLLIFGLFILFFILWFVEVNMRWAIRNKFNKQAETMKAIYNTELNLARKNGFLNDALICIRDQNFNHPGESFKIWAKTIAKDAIKRANKI